MENGIDLNKFYQGLDDLFQQKVRRASSSAICRWMEKLSSEDLHCFPVFSVSWGFSSRHL